MRLGHSIIQRKSHNFVPSYYDRARLGRAPAGRAERMSQPTEPRESFASYAINKGLITIAFSNDKEQFSLRGIWIFVIPSFVIRTSSFPRNFVVRARHIRLSPQH
jgi:hypothetical protein